MAHYVDETGILRPELVEEVPCLLCGSDEPQRLFEKEGFTFVQCGACDFVYVNPQLREDAVRDFYEDADHSTLIERLVASSNDYRKERFGKERLDIVESFAKQVPGRLLDVGCTTGFFLEAAAERGWDAHGMELNPYAAQVALAKGLQVRQEMIEEADYEPESFDAVTIFDVVEHVRKPVEMLEKVASLLRPDGVVLLYTPNWDSAERLLLGEACHFIWATNHLGYFTPKTLASALERAGFEVEWHETRGLDFEDALWYFEEHGTYDMEFVSGSGTSSSSSPTPLGTARTCVWSVGVREPQGLRRRRLARQLQQHQVGDARGRAHPDLQLQLIVGASALLDRFGSVVDVIEADGFTPDARRHDDRRGRDAGDDGQVDRARPARAADDVRAAEAGRRGQRRRPLRDDGHGDRRRLHEHPASRTRWAARSPARSTRASATPSPSWRTSTFRPTRPRARAHHPDGRAAGHRARRRLPADRPGRRDRHGRQRRLPHAEWLDREGVGAHIDLDQPFLLVNQHPVTTEYGHGEEQISRDADGAATSCEMPTIMLWPNVDAGSEDIATRHAQVPREAAARTTSASTRTSRSRPTCG